MDQKPQSFNPERRIAGPEERIAYKTFQDSIRTLRCKVQDLIVASKQNSITEKQYALLVTQLAKRLEDREGIDPLTNAFNRTFLDSELNKLKEELEHKEGTVMIIFSDLKDFKHLNDKEGHPVADKALIAVADRLKKVTKKIDMVFRYGGDEFLVLMPINDENPRTCKAIFDRVKKDVNAALSVVNTNGENVSFNVSMGHAVLSKGETTTNEELIAKADEEMYMDKREIKDKVN